MSSPTTISAYEQACAPPCWEVLDGETSDAYTFASFPIPQVCAVNRSQEM